MAEGIYFTCCFFGHRIINETDELKAQLLEKLEKLIIDEKVNIFLFGSKSRFNDLCLELVTILKKKYPHIKRVYVRAEYPYISEEYKKYLLDKYEETYYPEILLGSGKAVYVKRNYEMIEHSRFCVVYYDKKNIKRKSGTEIAVAYAKKMERNIIFFPHTFL